MGINIGQWQQLDCFVLTPPGPEIRFAIIANFASNSPSHMILGVGRLKKTVLAGVFSLAAAAVLAGCGGYSAPNQNNTGSGLKFRAFISQNVSSAGVSAGLDIVDASLDRLVRAPGVTVGPSPTFMQVAASKKTTLVFDSATNAIYTVTNSSETASGHVSLTDFSESMAISTDGTIAFAAVPNAALLGQPAGTVEVINVNTVALNTPIAVPGAHFVVLSPDNTKLLVFSDRENTVTLITLTNSGTTTSPNWVVSPSTFTLCGSGSPVPVCSPSNTNPDHRTITSLDHPIWGVFSADSKTAYILNCGGECGGTAASVIAMDANNLPAASPAAIPVAAATYGVLFGTQLYVAGTAPSAPNNDCAGANTAATTCGRLSVIDTSALQVTNSLVIADGTHNRMAVTSDNQVFVGAQQCTPVNTSNEQRGCLSIYNPSLNKVVVGTDPGDVTGIAVVTGRNEVYVIENGELRIWSTVTDALLPTTKQIDISGQAQDVAIVD
jgi:hypothetical protein